jgi:hypothetical protein
LPELKELWSNQTNWVAGKKYKERKLVEPISTGNSLETLKLWLLSLQKIYNFLFKNSHLSNNLGGWNKRVGVKRFQNQLDFFHQFLC